jgi:LacI family transcriptional regulator
MSVIGFDDSAHATSALPHLTTMRQDIRAVGECAARALLDCIDGVVKPGARLLVSAEPVLRETTAAPPPLIQR